MTSELDTEKTSGGRTRGPGAAGPPEGHPGLRVIQKASDHPCFQCAKCCTYVAVEIDSPGTMKEYDHIVWYLYHEGVSVFVDWNSDWFIKFETRCRHLTQEGMCGIYDRRPGICKDFDWRECENNVTDEAPDKWLFEDADTFMRWFEKQRPKTYKRYLRFLRRKHREGQDPELSRVSGGARRRAPRGR
jgi:Fe-S-cluster containining protein